MSTRENRGGGLSLFGHEVSAKGLKPRIVLALLLGGSFAGIWLSHLADPLSRRLFWWVAVVANGLLAGGLYWRLALYEEALFEDSEAARAVRRRWRRLETAAVWTLAFCGLFTLGVVAPGATGTLGETVFAAVLVLSPLLWLGLRRGSLGDDSRGAVFLRSLLLLAVLVSLASFAWLETGTTALDWLVRFGHLGAFALWLGGAAWHNGVVLPTMGSRPGAAAALTAQARRFRRHLPVAIAVVLATGVYQALQLLTLTPRMLLGTRIGHLVGAKLFVLAVLTALVVAGVKRGPPGADAE